MFHHNSTACDSILGLIFITIIGVENFRKGNLKRGKSPKSYGLSLKDFIKKLYAGYLKMPSILALVKTFLNEVGRFPDPLLLRSPVDKFI